MNIIATAPQRVTRPPRRAVRLRAAVAFVSLLLPILAFAEFGNVDSQNLNSVMERLVELNAKAYASNEKLQAITGYSYDIRNELLSNVSPYIQSIQSLLYSSLPTVAEALGSIKDYSDLSTDYLRLIKECLLNERVTILSNMETYLLGLAQKADDVYDSSTHSIRISSDPRVAVTNRVEVYSSSLSNQIERLVASTNRTYDADKFAQPGTSAYNVIWSRGNMLNNPLFGRTWTTVTLPAATGDFFTDAMVMLKYMAYVEGSVSRSGYVTVMTLDQVTNKLDRAYFADVAFHHANTNLLESIRSQDEQEYQFMDDFRTRILAWLDDQQERQQAADDKSEELLSEVESYQPESGEAGDQSFAGEDLSSRISDFDGLVSVLADRPCPQSLVIKFGGWSLFGAEVSDDPIVIPLTGVQSVLDFIRMGFSLLWWGLSLLVMWWLVRLVVQLQHKIVTWTFTTTNGPQS